MRDSRRGLILTIVLIAIFSLSSVAEAALFTDTGAGGARIRGYVVALSSNLDVDATTRRLAAKHGFGATHLYHSALHGFAAQLSTRQAAALSVEAGVRAVQPDLPLAIFDTVPTGVKRIGASPSATLAARTFTSAGLDVAVIDTGIDLTHPDLNVVGGLNCSDGGPRNYADAHGHGTHVAGIIAAKDNASGVVGVAPGARLWSVRVLDKNGSGSWSSLICGVDFVTSKGPANGGPIRVANMSLGGFGAEGTCTDGGLHEAICRATAAGVTFVAAAGNSTSDLGKIVPATFPEVLTVTAVADFNGLPGGGAASTCRADVDDTNADFSNYAVTAEDSGHTVAAPGLCILSTWLGGTYNTISGTSMASPHVAGAAVRCIAAGKCGGDPGAVRAKLRADAAAQAASYGFAGDPNQPAGTSNTTGNAWWKNRTSSTTKFFGYLVYAGAY